MEKVMTTIVSSSYTLDVPQIDGRRWVTETFVLDDDTTRSRQYLADVGTDYDAFLIEAANLQAELDTPPTP